MEGGGAIPSEDARGSTRLLNRFLLAEDPAIGGGIDVPFHPRAHSSRATNMVLIALWYYWCSGYASLETMFEPRSMSRTERTSDRL